MLNGSKVYSRKSPVLYYFLKETNKMVMLLPFLRRLKIPQVMLWFTNNLKDLGTSQYNLKIVSTMNCIRMKKNTRFARRKERIKRSIKNLKGSFFIWVILKLSKFRYEVANTNSYFSFFYFFYSERIRKKRKPLI